MSEMELYESTWKLASRVHQTPFVPRAMQGKPEHVLACVLYGNELGLGPMQSLNSIHIIEGRAAASPELMRALVAKAGHRIDVTENTNTACTMKGSRIDTGAEATVRWTLDDAKNANLSGKDNWKKYPRAMLAARATSELCRLLFPDVIAGLSYTPEEIQAITDQPTVTPVVEVTYESPAPLSPEEFEEVVIVNGGGDPSSLPAESEDEVTLDSDSALATAERLIMDAFPGTEVIDAELVPSKDVLAQRRAEAKTWGAWNRVRSVAIPMARAHKLPVPQCLDDILSSDELFAVVGSQFNQVKDK
jgi:hypothetical protein